MSKYQNLTEVVSENEYILLKYKINAPELHNFQDIKAFAQRIIPSSQKLKKSNIASEPQKLNLNLIIQRNN